MEKSTRNITENIYFNQNHTATFNIRISPKFGGGLFISVIRIICYSNIFDFNNTITIISRKAHSNNPLNLNEIERSLYNNHAVQLTLNNSL